jgi:starvation-inducible outer membrane lipoprotein
MQVGITFVKNERYTPSQIGVWKHNDRRNKFTSIKGKMEGQTHLKIEQDSNEYVVVNDNDLELLHILPVRFY